MQEFPPEAIGMNALPTDIERLALLSWRLYPASGRSKAACIKDPGASATFDLDTLEAWAREFPGCNWRMVCEGSEVWALDVASRPRITLPTAL